MSSAVTVDANANSSRAAKRHAHNTVAWKVDVEKFPTAKENLKLKEFPAVVVFKDGKEIKRAEALTPEKAKEIAAVLV
jgi:thioredoxin-like negative regulator of GroEL